MRRGPFLVNPHTLPASPAINPPSGHKPHQPTLPRRELVDELGQVRPPQEARQIDKRGGAGTSFPHNAGRPRDAVHSVMETAMPREQIMYMSTAMVDNDAKATTPAHGQAWSSPGLHVGWMPDSSIGDGHVQLCLEVDPRYLTYSEKLTTETQGEGTPIKLWSEALDRSELNKLIRTLRNARDKAYGRDE